MSQMIWKEMIMSYSEIAVHPQSDWVKPHQPPPDHEGWCCSRYFKMTCTNEKSEILTAETPYSTTLCSIRKEGCKKPADILKQSLPMGSQKGYPVRHLAYNPWIVCLSR